MDLVQYAQKRYTCKAYDASKTIPQDVLDQLLEALRLSASSVNSQPWHFFVAGNEESRARIARATESRYQHNHAKITNASHVLVFCAYKEFSEQRLQAIAEQEKRDGRGDLADQARRQYVAHHQQQGDQATWAQRQVYLALGGALSGASLLGLDATPIEGFDNSVLDAELELAGKNLASVVILSLGYHSDQDYNCALKKSRLPAEEIFTYL